MSQLKMAEKYVVNCRTHPRDVPSHYAHVPGFGAVYPCPQMEGKFVVEELILDDQGYDKGGWYWGCPSPEKLYVAMSEDDYAQVIHFFWALDEAEVWARVKLLYPMSATPVILQSPAWDNKHEPICRNYDPFRHNAPSCVAAIPKLYSRHCATITYETWLEPFEIYKTITGTGSGNYWSVVQHYNKLSPQHRIIAYQLVLWAYRQKDCMRTGGGFRGD